MLDPTFKLFRTHWLSSADSPALPRHSDRTRPITFACEIIIGGASPNGCIYEIGKDDHGVIIWVDSALGELGFAAGRGTGVAPNDGVSGVTKLNHLSATVAVVSAPGNGYSENDLITLTRGTFGRATVLRVTGETAGAIATVSVEDGGTYSVAPGNPVAQGSVAPPGGSAATFTMTYSLVRTAKISIVCAVIPGNGSIRMWVDGHLRVAEQSVSGSFDTATPADSSWAEGPGGGDVGDVAGSANNRAPAGARAAVSNLTIVAGRVSSYDDQRPQQYYTGLLV